MTTARTVIRNLGGAGPYNDATHNKGPRNISITGQWTGKVFSAMHFGEITHTEFTIQVAGFTLRGWFDGTRGTDLDPFMGDDGSVCHWKPTWNLQVQTPFTSGNPAQSSSYALADITFPIDDPPSINQPAPGLPLPDTVVTADVSGEFSIGFTVDRMVTYTEYSDPQLGPSVPLWWNGPRNVPTLADTLYPEDSITDAPPANQGDFFMQFRPGSTIIVNMSGGGATVAWSEVVPSVVASPNTPISVEIINWNMGSHIDNPGGYWHVHNDANPPNPAFDQYWSTSPIGVANTVTVTGIGPFGWQWGSPGSSSGDHSYASTQPLSCSTDAGDYTDVMLLPPTVPYTYAMERRPLDRSAQVIWVGNPVRQFSVDLAVMTPDGFYPGKVGCRRYLFGPYGFPDLMSKMDFEIAGGRFTDTFTEQVARATFTVLGAPGGADYLINTGVTGVMYALRRGLITVDDQDAFSLLSLGEERDACRMLFRGDWMVAGTLTQADTVTNDPCTSLANWTGTNATITQTPPGTGPLTITPGSGTPAASVQSNYGVKPLILSSYAYMELDLTGPASTARLGLMGPDGITRYYNITIGGTGTVLVDLLNPDALSSGAFGPTDNRDSRWDSGAGTNSTYGWAWGIDSCSLLTLDTFSVTGSAYTLTSIKQVRRGGLQSPPVPAQAFFQPWLNRSGADLGGVLRRRYIQGETDGKTSLEIDDWDVPGSTLRDTFPRDAGDTMGDINALRSSDLAPLCAGWSWAWGSGITTSGCTGAGTDSEYYCLMGPNAPGLWMMAGGARYTMEGSGPTAEFAPSWKVAPARVDGSGGTLYMQMLLDVVGFRQNLWETGDLHGFYDDRNSPLLVKLAACTVLRGRAWGVVEITGAGTTAGRRSGVEVSGSEHGGAGLTSGFGTTDGMGRYFTTLPDGRSHERVFTDWEGTLPALYQDVQEPADGYSILNQDWANRAQKRFCFALPAPPTNPITAIRSPWLTEDRLGMLHVVWTTQGVPGSGQPPTLTYARSAQILPPFEVQIVIRSGDLHFPRVEVDSRGRVIVLYQVGIDDPVHGTTASVWEVTCDDDAGSFTATAVERWALGNRPAIAASAAGVLRACISSNQIVGLFQDHPSAPPAAITFMSGGSALVPNNPASPGVPSTMGLAYDPVTARWLLHVTISGESATSLWTSADDGQTWTRSASAGIAGGVYPTVAVCDDGSVLLAAMVPFAVPDQATGTLWMQSWVAGAASAAFTPVAGGSSIVLDTDSFEIGQGSEPGCRWAMVGSQGGIVVFWTSGDDGQTWTAI